MDVKLTDTMIMLVKTHFTVITGLLLNVEMSIGMLTLNNKYLPVMVYRHIYDNKILKLSA